MCRADAMPSPLLSGAVTTSEMGGGARMRRGHESNGSNLHAEHAALSLHDPVRTACAPCVPGGRHKGRETHACRWLTLTTRIFLSPRFLSQASSIHPCLPLRNFDSYDGPYALVPLYPYAFDGEKEAENSSDLTVLYAKSLFDSADASLPRASPV